MGKKILVLSILCITLFTGFVSAGTLEIGAVNYTTYAAIEGGDFEALPGLRVQFNLLPIFGVSADAIYWDENYYGFELALIANAVAKLPIAFLEPYLAAGPMYVTTIPADDSMDIPDPVSVGYNVRGGLDLNVTSWLSVGVESNFFVDDIEAFAHTVAGATPEELWTAVKEFSLIGLTAKIKL